MSTTQRLIGKGGTANAGSTSGASDIYSGADIEEWQATLETDTEEMTGLGDNWKVKQWLAQGGSGTIKKMVVTAPFLAQIADDPVVYLELFYGIDRSGTATTGGSCCSGLAILKNVSVQNPAGKVVENVSFEFTGEVTVN